MGSGRTLLLAWQSSYTILSAVPGNLRSLLAPAPHVEQYLATGGKEAMNVGQEPVQAGDRFRRADPVAIKRVSNGPAR